MSAKRKSRAGSSLRRFLFLFFLLALVGGGVYLVWFSPFFVIQSIDIVGAEFLPEPVPTYAPGGNIIFWQPGLNLGEMSQVAALEINKDYWQRRITLVFQGKEKFAIWCLEKNNQCFWIDKTGVVFDEAPNLRGPLVFRLVRDYSERSLSLGERVLDEELFTNLLESLAFLESLDIPVGELKIENLKFKEIIALTHQGPDIYFSLLADPSFGQGVVSSLRQSGEWQSLNYLDLRVPNRAYYSR